MSEKNPNNIQVSVEFDQQREAHVIDLEAQLAKVTAERDVIKKDFFTYTKIKGEAFDWRLGSRKKVIERAIAHITSELQAAREEITSLRADAKVMAEVILRWANDCSGECSMCSDCQIARKYTTKGE